MYIYHNENPNGYKVPDCVIRALTLALNMPYYEVVKLLEHNGTFYDCDLLNKKCYQKLLDIDFRFPHKICESKKTVQEVADDFPENTLLIRVDGHITVAIGTIIYDIFDCTNEYVTDFWLVR